MPLTDSAPSSPVPGQEDWYGSTGPEEKDLAIQQLARQPAPARDSATPADAPRPLPYRWQVGAYVASGTNESINAYAREEIAGGAEALLFRLLRQPGPRDLATILDGIAVDRISLHCSLRYPGQDPAELFRDLVHYLRKAGYDLQDIEGSVDFDPLLDWSDPPFPPLIRLLYFVGRWMPRFRVLQVNAAGFNNGVTTADTELALAVAKGVEYLRQLEDGGYPAGLANRHLKFAFTVGTSVYGDIAKLRAFRVLWQEALSELSISQPPPTQLSAHTDVVTLGADAADNRMRLQTQAVSAVAGGADLLFLAPIEGIDQPPSPRGRKTARDTQRALGGRADLFAALDGAYLDQLTLALAGAARRRYQRIRAQGGFARATDF